MTFVNTLSNYLSYLGTIDPLTYEPNGDAISWQAPTEIASISKSTVSQMFVGNVGDRYVLWIDNTAGNSGIYARFGQSYSQAYGPIHKLTSTREPFLYPHVFQSFDCCLASNFGPSQITNTYAIWIDKSSGNDYLYYYLYYYYLLGV